MTSPITIAVLPSSSHARPCRECSQPISLRQAVSTGRWLAFEADPVVLSIIEDGGSLIRGGRILHLLDAADQHRCRTAQRQDRS